MASISRRDLVSQWIFFLRGILTDICKRKNLLWNQRSNEMPSISWIVRASPSTESALQGWANVLHIFFINNSFDIQVFTIPPFYIFFHFISYGRSKCWQVEAVFCIGTAARITSNRDILQAVKTHITRGTVMIWSQNLPATILAIKNNHKLILVKMLSKIYLLTLLFATDFSDI